MNSHPYNIKGDSAITRVATRLVDMGYYVYVPLSNNPPNDLMISDGEGNHLSVEVKARGKWSEGKNHIGDGYKVSFYTSSTRSGASKNKEKRKLTCDLLAIYLLEEDVIIFVTKELMISRKAMTFRTSYGKNGQKKGVNLISEFLTF